MKRLLALCLLLASQVQAAIVYVGTGAVAQSSTTVSFAIPAGSNNDLILCTAAMQNAALTFPAPSGYTELASGTTYNFHKVWARIATGSDTFTLTSPPGYLIGSCSRYSGTSTNLASIVDVVAAKRATQTTIALSALTPTANNELVFYSLRGKQPGAGTSLATPTHFTERNDSYYSAGSVLMSTGDWLQTTATTSAAANIVITPVPTTAENNSAIILALVPSAGGGAVTITNVNTTNIFTSTATGLVITGTGFGASQGGGGVALVDGTFNCAQTVTAWADTSITFSAALGNCRYGSRTIRVTNNGGSNSTQSVTVQAPTGKCYFDLGTLLQPFSVNSAGAPNRFGDAANDITNNSELEFSNMTFTGGSSCANITVNSDGSYVVPVDLTTLDWLWNDGTAGWTDTGVSRTGQGKVHIPPSGGFRYMLSCTNGGTIPTPPPTRGAADKRICASGCDYPNTTSGIQNCMNAISAGQVCEMISGTSDGSADVWAAQIALSSVSGTSGNPKTLRVQDGSSIIFSMATGTGQALLSLTNVSNINIQGNSVGTNGLYIGDASKWAFTCAQAASSPTFVGPTNCYPNDMSTSVTGSNNIGLMNMSIRGAAANIASQFDSSSSYIYLRQDFVDLHGVNDNRAPTNPAESGLLMLVNSDHFLAEDTTFSHGGSAALKLTGSFAILRRVIGDGDWNDLTGSTTYVGTDPIQVALNDCTSGTYGCAPYGPALIEGSQIIESGLTPSTPTYNVAIRLNGLGVIFRENYVYQNVNNYLISICGTNDSSDTAYSEGEQSIYNNTFWGGASFWTAGAGYPATISTSICQLAIIADNLFQGAQPGIKSPGEVYAFTAGLSGVPKGTYTNQWKGWKVFSNIFGVDPTNPSLNMQVALTGTGGLTSVLTDSTTWPANFYNNSNTTLTWTGGSNVPSQSPSGLVIATTSSIGVGDSAPITTTTAAGSGVTAIPLATARPFKDDWGFNNHTFGGFHTEYGDCIAVGPLSTSHITDAIPVRIATGGVNYTTNVVTAISSMTFASGSPVWKAIDNGDGSCGRALQNRGASQ